MKKRTFRKLAMAGLILVAVLLFVGLLALAARSPEGATAGLLAAPFAFGLMGQTTGMEKSAKCTAAIATAYTIAKFGADDDTLSAATASTEELIGVFQHTTSAVGDEVRVMLSGITRVVLGGTVTRGGWITSDANAKGVAAAPGAGVNAAVIGRALASGVAGDIVAVLLAPGRIQG
jgi:hypothetical protein